MKKATRLLFVGQCSSCFVTQPLQIQHAHMVKRTGYEKLLPNFIHSFLLLLLSKMVSKQTDGFLVGVNVGIVCINVRLFPLDTFEKLFASIDADHDGVLSCVESELLFYLYSADVMKKVPIENVPQPPIATAGAAAV